MIKKIKTIIKLALIAGKATSAPPIGPALGQYGINLSSFCKEYNSQTNDKIGLIVPVKITIYEDKSYSFILKSSPTAALLLKLANIKKGTKQQKLDTCGILTKSQIEEIAKIKLNDLNTENINKAILIIEGTAKSVGIKII